MAVLRMRRRVEVNTDPQRRCYDGCHFSSELRWMPWEVLDSELDPSKAEAALAYWRELNEYAVSQRGKSAACEFEVVQEAAS